MYHQFQIFFFLIIITGIFCLTGCSTAKKFIIKTEKKTLVLSPNNLDTLSNEILRASANLAVAIYNSDAQSEEVPSMIATHIKKEMELTPSLSNYKLFWVGYVEDIEKEETIQNTDHLSIVVQSQEDPNVIYLVHRGTVMNFKNIWEDINVLKTVAYPISTSGSLISSGLHDALDHFKDMKAVFLEGNSNSKVSFYDLLKTLLEKKSGSSPLTLMVVGHSLGGALATLTAIDILDFFRKEGFSEDQLLVKVIAISSQTIGNKIFVNYYNSKITEHYHILTAHDIVPKLASDLNTLPESLEYTFGNKNAATFTEVSIRELAASASAKLKLQKYIHPKKLAVLDIDPVPPNDQCKEKITSIIDFACWLKYHHSSKTYLNLINQYIESR